MIEDGAFPYTIVSLTVHLYRYQVFGSLISGESNKSRISSLLAGPLTRFSTFFSEGVRPACGLEPSHFRWL